MEEKGHHVYCSAAGWPCPIGCRDWPENAREMFPNMPGDFADELNASVEERGGVWSGKRRDGTDE